MLLKELGNLLLEKLRAIEILRRAGVREALMAGQVKHRQIFSDIVPDLKLVGVLARLALQNTDSLIGAVAEALSREGITLLPSVAFLGDQLATPGAMTRRRPRRDERADIEYGEVTAHTKAGTVGIKCWIFKGEQLPQRPGAAAVGARP